MKLHTIITAFLTLALTAASLAKAPSDVDATSSSASEAEALAAWQKVYEVFSHPRCANCHVPEDNIPRWSGPSYGLTQGEWLNHGINITGGESRIGAESIPCMACHQSTNAELPHAPPGAPTWRLAPVEMVWWKKSSQEICQQIKDPKRNGGRSLQEVADHIGHDALVQWGWAPGPGREPAPYSSEEVVNFLESWRVAGAPCPAPTE